MKSIRVTYTVKKEFAQKNVENIKLFLKDVRKIANSNMQYFVLLAEDGVTFSHLSIYKNDAAQNRFLSLESFKSFQRQRDESGLEKEPAIEAFVLVDSSQDISRQF